jgi:hypothetical protein
MLRWRLVLLPNRQPHVVVSDPMKHLASVRIYRVLTTRKEILGAMESPTFNPREEVIGGVYRPIAKTINTSGINAKNRLTRSSAQTNP